MSDAEVHGAFHEHVVTIQAFRTQDLNEAMTRKYLIDPLLAILGFQSPQELQLEVRVPNTGEAIDYELIVDDKPRAIVEAKSLRNEITEQHAAQCVKYAALLGVQWCLVTNGFRWSIYDAYAPVALSEKLVVEVRLDDDARAIDDAWRVLSDFRRDALRQSEPLSEILTERIVAQEFRRPDSSAVKALRSAIKARVGHRVSAESVVAALARMMGGKGGSSAPSSQTIKVARRGVYQALDRGGLRDLVDAGLLPPDAVLEMRYKTDKYVGHVRHDQIEVNGATYASLSEASKRLRKVKASNGWRDWCYNGETLDAIRKRWRAAASTEAPRAFVESRPPKFQGR